MDRRNFLKASAGAAALLGMESFSFRARAALAPSRARLGHLDLSGGDGKDPALDKKILADLVDLLSKPIAEGEGKTTILTSGPVNAPKSVSSPAFRMFVLGSAEAVELHDMPMLKEWLVKNGGSSTPVVLATSLPLDVPRRNHRQAEAERRELLEILSNYPEFVLVLSGGANRAVFLPDGPLALGTAPAIIYPCGGRSVDLEVTADGTVRVESRFVQSRFLADVENLYRRGAPDEANLRRLGGRADRQLVATAGVGGPKIEPVKFTASPSLAPWPAAASRLDLAIVTDTHLVLDKHVDEREKKIFNLIGHSLEQDSKTLIADVLAQVAEGRHRVEFFDEVFAQDPQADQHFLDRPVDGLLLLGDVTETGERDEAEEFKALLDRLPAKLRGQTLLVPGNHDLKNFFSPQGMASDRRAFCDLFSDYGTSQGSSYRVELSEWCALLMLDSVIATGSAMGFSQELIDWVEDQLEQSRGKVVLVACHHDLYQLSLVPPALYAYLRSQSHFTGRKSAARAQLHELFAKHNCVKLCLTGHYHSVVADVWRKKKGVGDPHTVHLQSPCVTEYPCGYRVLRLAREGGKVKAEYLTAYTRKWEIRQKSMNCFGYRLAGTQPRTLPGYEGTLKELQGQEGFFGDLGFLDPYDLVKLNVRGFKDGTGNMGLGNGRLKNINDSCSFSL